MPRAMAHAFANRPVPATTVYEDGKEVDLPSLDTWQSDGELYISLTNITLALLKDEAVGTMRKSVSRCFEAKNFEPTGKVSKVDEPDKDGKESGVPVYLLSRAVELLAASTSKPLLAITQATPSRPGWLALQNAAERGVELIENHRARETSKEDETKLALELGKQITALQRQRVLVNPSAVLDDFLELAAWAPRLKSLMLAHFEKLPVAEPVSTHMTNIRKMGDIEELESDASVGNFPYLALEFEDTPTIDGGFVELHPAWEGCIAWGSKRRAKPSTVEKRQSQLKALEHFASHVKLHTMAGGAAPVTESGLQLGNFDSPLDFIRAIHTLLPAFFCHRYTHKESKWANNMADFQTLALNVTRYLIKQDSKLKDEMHAWAEAIKHVGQVMQDQTGNSGFSRAKTSEVPIEYVRHMQKCARIGMVYTVLSCLPDGLVSSEDKADLLKARDYIAALTVYGTHQHVFAGPFRPGNIATAHRHDWTPPKGMKHCMDDRCAAKNKSETSGRSQICRGNRPYLLGDGKCAVPHFEEKHFKTEDAPVHAGHFVYPYQEKGVALQAMLLYSVDVRHRLKAKPEADHLLLLSPKGLAPVGHNMYTRLRGALVHPHLKYNASSLRAGCIGPEFQTELRRMAAESKRPDLVNACDRYLPLIDDEVQATIASAGKTSGTHIASGGAYDRRTFEQHTNNYNLLAVTYQGLHHTRRWSVSRAIHLLNGRTVVAPDGDAAELGDVLAPHLTDDPLPYELKICLDHYGIGLDAVGLEPEHFEAKPEEDAELAWHIEKLPGGARLPLAREPEEPAADRKRKAPASEEDEENTSEASAQTA